MLATLERGGVRKVEEYLLYIEWDKKVYFLLTRFEQRSGNSLIRLMIKIKLKLKLKLIKKLKLMIKINH